MELMSEYGRSWSKGVDEAGLRCGPSRSKKPNRAGLGAFAQISSVRHQILPTYGRYIYIYGIKITSVQNTMKELLLMTAVLFKVAVIGILEPANRFG